MKAAGRPFRNQWDFPHATGALQIRWPRAAQGHAAHQLPPARQHAATGPACTKELRSRYTIPTARSTRTPRALSHHSRRRNRRAVILDLRCPSMGDHFRRPSARGWGADVASGRSIVAKDDCLNRSHFATGSGGADAMSSSSRGGRARAEGRYGPDRCRWKSLAISRGAWRGPINTLSLACISDHCTRQRSSRTSAVVAA